MKRTDMMDAKRQAPQGKKGREQSHFDGEGIYVISFLERDDTAIGRFLIKLILSFWDRHLKFVKPEWIKGKKVLEAGCGNPRDVHYFKALGAELAAGCDISEGVVRRGLKTKWTYALNLRMPNDTPAVFVADCESIPALDHSFDTVFIIQAAHHIDLSRFLQEAGRVLKPKGILFISDPNGGHPLRGPGDRIGRSLHVMSQDEKSLPPGAVTEKLRNAGFDIVAQHAVNLFSELFFLFTVIVETRKPSAAAVLQLVGLPPLIILDKILEASIFRIFPTLSWRHIVVARKK
jgi:SAM-dependent methyltransferase